MIIMHNNLEDEHHAIKAARREQKRRVKMKVSGKSVFALRALLARKAKAVKHRKAR